VVTQELADLITDAQEEQQQDTLEVLTEEHSTIEERIHVKRQVRHLILKGLILDLEEPVLHQATYQVDLLLKELIQEEIEQEFRREIIAQLENHLL